MAQVQITLEELEADLTALIEAGTERSPIIGALFQAMYNTGLRACEVLEVERWRDIDSEYFEVQLSKGEGSREIPIVSIPEILRDAYTAQVPFFLETYSAVNNLYKRTGPVLHFGENEKRTTMHAFRYRFIKMRAAEGRTVSEIAQEIKHVNLANTARYMLDRINKYEVQ